MTRIVSALLLALTVAFAGCGPSPGSRTQTIVYGRGSDAQTLDPIHASSGETVNVLVNLYDTLVQYDDKTIQLVPGLAEKWESTPDGLTWTFFLRKGVKFHDGTPCDAAAIVFNFERLLVADHPHVYHGAPPYSPQFNMVAGVKADGADKIVFTLKHPSPIFLKNVALFSAGICSPAAVKQHRAEYAQHPVGTGAYKFVRWNPDQEIVLAANPDYWNGKPANDRVIFIPVRESAIRVKQLERGEIHVADNLPPTELKALESSPGIAFQQQPGMNVGYLAIQNEKPIVKNPKVRQAIWHAIDKQGLIDKTYAGQAKAAVNMMPPNFPGYHNGLVDRPYDPAKAKQLLAEAAAEDGFTLPAKLRLFVMNGPRPYLQQPKETAIYLQDAFKRVGLDVEIVAQETNLHFQALSRGDHDLGLIGWTSDSHDADTFLYSLLDPDNINAAGGNNVCYYRRPEVHALLTQAQRELDESKRNDLYRQAQDLIYADVPAVPLVHTDLRIAQRAELKDYYLHPSSLVRLRHAHLDK